MIRISTIDPDHLPWFRHVHRITKRGAKWLVPRSGLIFQKCACDAWHLVDPKPWVETTEKQDFDIAGVMAHFAMIDIVVHVAGWDQSRDIHLFGTRDDKIN